jgi:hypothetical protein
MGTRDVHPARKQQQEELSFGEFVRQIGWSLKL